MAAGNAAQGGIAIPPFVRFLVTGGIAAAANLGSRIALSMVTPFEWAVAFAYLIGMITAYILARLFVFEASKRAVGAEFLRFAMVNVVSLAIVWLVSVGLASWLFPAVGFAWHPQFVAHLIGVLSPVALSYYAHKLFTFRRRG